METQVGVATAVVLGRGGRCCSVACLAQTLSLATANAIVHFNLLTQDACTGRALRKYRWAQTEQLVCCSNFDGRTDCG